VSLSTGDLLYVPLFDMYFPSNINCANVFVLVVSKVPSPLIELLVMVLKRSMPDSPVIDVDMSVRMYWEW